MSPHHPQLDPTALAWLQLLQSQAPVQDSPDLASSSGAHANVQEHPGRSPTQPLPDDSVGLEDDNDSETERAATAEDKRRRNTAASGNPTLTALSGVSLYSFPARFRTKKKQWLLDMERTVTGLSRQVDDLEREAAELRRENGWLKEIVMLRTRKLTGGSLLNLPGSSGDRNETGQPGGGKGKQRQQ